MITGGGSGIGLMATQALAANGAKVYIVGRTEEKLERVAELYSSSGGGQIIPVTADVTQKQDIALLLKEVESREPHLSVLINNAGISGESRQDVEGGAQQQQHASHGLKGTLFDDSSATFDDWTSVYRTNVAQLYFLTSAFLPLLQKGTEAEHGFSSTVINISSISGIIKSSQHHFAYNASKAAAIHLTKMLAHEINNNAADLKIRINNIAPGVFPSEMTAGASDEKQKSALAKEKYEEKVPAQRPGTDQDMGNAVLFAATNQYLNGQTVVVDGGYVLAAGSA